MQTDRLRNFLGTELAPSKFVRSVFKEEILNTKLFITACLSSLLILTNCQNNSDDSPDLTPPTAAGSEDPPTPAPAPPPTPPAPNAQPDMPLPNGRWGTDGLRMIVRTSSVEVQYPCSLGKINGKIRPDRNSQFSRRGTIQYFNNETGENESYPAVFSGIVSANKSVIALRITADDARTNEGTQSTDYILKRNFEPPGWVCALESSN